MKTPALILLLALFSLECCVNTGNSQKADLADIDPNDPVLTTAKKPVQDSLISLLPTMKAKALDCSADIYWKIIKRGKASVPLLIESLTNTTLTNVYDSCKHGKLNVGEIAYFALEEIAEFPAFLVTHIQFDQFEGRCWNFYPYLFDDRNKREYQRMVHAFYNAHDYIYTTFNKRELTPCRMQYGIKGKYILKE